MSGKVIDYNVIRSNTVGDVITDTKAFIKAGWQPLGPMQFVFQTNNHTQYLFTQTVVLYEIPQ